MKPLLIAISFVVAIGILEGLTSDCADTAGVYVSCR